MRKAPIATLYQGLTNKERAALAFCYLTETNELELDRLVAAVPLKAYVCPDAEYQAWFDRIFNMASLWAIEHWKAQAAYFRTLGGGQLMLGFDDGATDEALSESAPRSST